MSERPMAVPAELPEARYAELMLRLPPEWPLEDEAFKDESVYWPLRVLKFLARFPHEYDTWLGYSGITARSLISRPATSACMATRWSSS